MEARRSRLERMQTLPNIKLISPTSASRRGTILDSTPEVPSDEDACTQQRQQRRPAGPRGKTMAFVKRMSESRFFQTDRSPWRQASSPILRHFPHLEETTTTTTTTPTVTRSNADDQLQATTSQYTTGHEQPGNSDEVIPPGRELNVTDNEDVGGSGDESGEVLDTDTNQAETLADQTPTDDEVEQVDLQGQQLLLAQNSEEHLSTAVVTDEDDTAEMTPLSTTDV